MKKFNFLLEDEEEQEEKLNTKKFDFGVPLGESENIETQFGIGASAVGGATLTKPTPAIGVSQRMRDIGEAPKEYSLEGVTVELSEANKKRNSLWWSELQSTDNKLKFLKQENWSPELQQADLETQKLSEEASKLGVNTNDWIRYGVHAAFFTGMAAQVLPLVSQLPKNILNNLAYKVEGKTVKGQALKDILKRVAYPETGKPSIFDRKVFDEFIKKGGVKGIGGSLKKGVTITEAIPRFAFGNKLYAGLPADEIVKSLVEVGKVSAEAVKGLDPVKVSQVTQQLLNINPALASEFLKAVEKPEVPTKEVVEVEAPEPISDKEILNIGNIVDSKLKNIGIETEQIHFVGSEVTGKTKPTSDIDIYIVPKNKDLWKTQEEYNELIKRINKSLPYYKGRKLDIILEKDFEPRGWETKIIGEKDSVRLETSFKEQPIKTYKPEPTTPKALEPLAEEARKYGSAEEFVEAQDRTYSVGDGFGMGKIIENPFKEGVQSPQKAQEMTKYINSNKDKYNPNFIKFYHGTDPNIPVEEEGLLPTSEKRRRSYQSQSGYVYLANTPERAKTFGDLGNQSNSIVYEVIVPVNKILPDIDQLNNIRSTGVNIGNTIGESIIYGGGVRIKGKIEAYAIRKVPDLTKSQLTDFYKQAAAKPKGEVAFNLKDTKILKESNENGFIYNIYLGDEYIGSQEVWDMGNDKWKLENLNVEPEYRRKGVASKLIEHITKDMDIPYSKFDWGMQTAEGAKLKKTLDKKYVPTKPKPVPVAKKEISEPAPKDVYTKGGKITKGKVKPLVRKTTGQTKEDKIEIAENDILKLVLRGEAKGARKAFSEGKKEGIFKAKENFADVVARAKERKFKAGEIGKIKKILQKTDLKELRPERQKAIKAIIDDIDLKRMTEKTKRKLTSRLDFIKDNPDNQIPPEKIAELERLNKKPIADFTAEDITLIKNAILHEINLNKLKNKYIFGNQIKEASEVLKTARANIVKGKDIKKDSGSIIDSSITEHETFGQRIKRLWKLDSWNPETICEELDSMDHGAIMKYVYNGIDKGVSTEEKTEDDINLWFWDKRAGIKIDNWSKGFQVKKKNIDFQKIKLSGYKLPNGETVGDRTMNITKGERISFLLHEKNEKNYAHLAEGGFRYADNIAKKHHLSENNINEIINSATKDEVKIADIMWEGFNIKIKDLLNEASMELNGWEVATEDNYFPIRTVQLDRKRDMLKARKTFADKTLEGMGIFKERTNAKNALIIEDAFNVFAKHVKQVSAYIGLAKPLRYAKLLLEDTELQENIMKVYRKPYIDNLKDYLQRIEDNSTNVDNFDKLTIEAINKLDIAILGMHIFVSLKQPVSYLIAGTEMDTKYLRKGLIAKNVYAEIKRNSPQLKRRLDGQINREMGELGNVGRTRQFFLHESPLNNKLLYMIRATDTMTIGRIWNAVKLEIKDKYPDLSGDEYFEKVTERAEEVIRRTQPTWHVKDRSSIGRSRSIWVRLWTKYTSQRNKHINALKRANLKYNRSEHTAKDKIDWLKRTTTILVVSSLMIGMIDELRRRAYGTKSKSIWEFAINTIAVAVGNFYFVGNIFNSLKSKIQKGTYAGYDTGNIVSSYIDNALDGLAELGRTLDQLKTQERYKSGSRKGELKWESTAIRALDRSASSFLAFKGLPYDNLKRLLSGMWKMAGEKKEKITEPVTIDFSKISGKKFTFNETSLRKSEGKKFSF